MSCPISTRTACLPITALSVSQHEKGCLLFVGQGPFLHAYDLNSNHKLYSIRVFDVQVIHDISVAPSLLETGRANQLLIALVGGGSVALLSIAPLSKGQWYCKYVLHAQDWVLRIHYHDRGDDTGCFVLLTANNALLRLNCSNFGNAEPAIHEIAHGPKSFLYSGDICSVDSRKLILAGGSAFGEVLVWTCFPTSPESDYVAASVQRFDAHNGSIFGIRTSGPIPVSGAFVRLVASCSDDRQIQIRKISDANDQVAARITPRIQNTGFGNQSKADSQEVAMIWGHQSRIWGVDFAEMEVDKRETRVQLLSRGEDATCQLWQLDLHRDDTKHSLQGGLRLNSADRHHAGKHMWSFSHHVTDVGTALVSGGADGKVVWRRLPSFEVGTREHFAVMFKDIAAAANSKLLKEYLIVDSAHTLALTNSGEITLRMSADQQTPRWQSIVSPSGSKVTKLCSNCPSGIAIVTTEFGLAFWSPSVGDQLIETGYSFPQLVANLQLAETSLGCLGIENTAFLVLTIVGSTSAFFIELKIAEDVLTVHGVCTISLACGFEVTASCFHVSSRTLILGSRSGSLTFFDLSKNGSDSAGDICSTHKVHGTDAVTSLTLVPQRSDQERRGRTHILTTGRDGTYGIHEVDLNHTTHYSFRTVHRSSPPIGPNVEGAIFDAFTKELILFGFRSKNFVVWNESRQMTIASVDCGGAHRSWAYRDHDSGEGTFVWTKAGALNLLRTGADQAKIIQNGGHGREIKALAISSRPFTTTRFGKCKLVATGAEDTEIRLFAIATEEVDSLSQFACLAVLRDHTTGPQHLRFSSSGNHLVSSGGCEQLYVWRLTYDVPSVEVGVVLQDKMPQADEDADVRIMHFALLEVNVSPRLRSGDVDLSIAAAYSNGKAKIINYKQGPRPGEGEFHFLREVILGSFCLTHVGMHSTGPSESPMMVTAGTNGYLSFSRMALIGSTSTDPEQLELQRVHQSSIQALEPLELLSDLWLIVTGGDDNALGFTIRQSHSSSARQYRTLLIPNAHAAALTALVVIDSWDGDGSCHAVIVTAGNDQRLKAWRIEVPFLAPHEVRLPIDEVLDSMKVVKVSEAWTCVADVSNIEKLQRESVDGEKRDGFDVMVVGVGMEVVRITIGE